MQFYMIPLASIRVQGDYKIWYAAWSAVQPTVYWTETRPDISPDGKSTWVVAVAQVDSAQAAAALGPDAIELWTGAKELPAPPAQLPPGDIGISGFRAAFPKWMERRDG